MSARNYSHKSRSRLTFFSFPIAALLAHCRGKSALPRSARVGELASVTGGRPITLAVTEQHDTTSPNTLVDVEVFDREFLSKRPSRAARLFTSLRDSFGEGMVGDDVCVAEAGSLKTKNTETDSSFVSVTTGTGRLLKGTAVRLLPKPQPLRFMSQQLT